MLRERKLCRTVQEEVQHLVSKTPVVDAPNTIYAQHVRQLLQCCLQSFSETKEFTLCFFDGSNLDVSSNFDPKTNPGE
jgi:hypothetical protein